MELFHVAFAGYEVAVYSGGPDYGMHAEVGHLALGQYEESPEDGPTLQPRRLAVELDDAEAVSRLYEGLVSVLQPIAQEVLRAELGNLERRAARLKAVFDPPRDRW